MFTRTFSALCLALTLGACHRGTPVAPVPPAELNVVSGGSVQVLVDGAGYHPSTIRTSAGATVRLQFRRITADACGEELVVPSLNIRRALPLNQTVEVTLPAVTGRLAFTCGMNMLQGAVVAQ